MENSVDLTNIILRKKYSFPKMVAEECHVLSGWETQFGIQKHKHEWNESIAFSTISDGKELKKFE